MTAFDFLIVPFHTRPIARCGQVQRNLRANVHRRYDGAGVVTHERYDFQGNLVAATRRLTSDHTAEPDWSAEVALEAEALTGRTRFDALDRPVSVTATDGSVLRPGYNVANLLERLDADIPEPTAVVTNVDYNARGQRLAVEHGNGTRTSYAYDPLRFRLVDQHAGRRDGAAKRSGHPPRQAAKSRRGRQSYSRR